MAANRVEVAPILVKTKAELRQIVDSWITDNQIIGLVPTMGALHKGHLELVKTASISCNKIICTIFVNPTQFNDQADFERYPRNWEDDVAKLSSVPCDLVFIPEVSEVYDGSVDMNQQFDFGIIATSMEGAYRPGHFNGVGMVVKRLFELTTPHKAFFGKKDFQQYAIIRKLVSLFDLPIEIIGIETVREPDGLAMSSRNTLLTAENREMAPVIYGCLVEMRKQYGKIPVSNLKFLVEQRLSAIPEVKIDYIEIADEITLQPVNDSHIGKVRGFIAAFFGKIRLIDNLDLN